MLERTVLTIQIGALQAGLAHVTKGTVLLSFLVSGTAFPEGSTTTYQTMPNSSTRDYRAPSFVTEGDVTYQTLPNSSFRDYRAPTYVTKGNTTYQTMPNSSFRDWRAPSYVTSKGKR